jgi:hypothetical protein
MEQADYQVAAESKKGAVSRQEHAGSTQGAGVRSEQGAGSREQGARSKHETPACCLPHATQPHSHSHANSHTQPYHNSKLMSLINSLISPHQLAIITTSYNSNHQYLHPPPPPPPQPVIISHLYQQQPRKQQSRLIPAMSRQQLPPSSSTVSAPLQPGRAEASRAEQHAPQLPRVSFLLDHDPVPASSARWVAPPCRRRRRCGGAGGGRQRGAVITFTLATLQGSYPIV